jgi:hypothetical protein
MITRLLIAFCVMATCVVLHAAGLAFAMRWRDRVRLFSGHRYGQDLGRLVLVAGWTVTIHLVEIALWALLYVHGHGMPDIDSAIYFSAVTYTTVGYGDLVLPMEWRLVGGIEALTGILMCGWSTGFFFTIVNEMMYRGGVQIAPGASLRDDP